MMITCYSVQLLLLYYMICCVFSADNCSLKSGECGYKGECNGTICLCPSGYVLHKNNRDCQSELCELNDCVECPSKDKCSRCVNFISHESGKCIEQCNGKAKILFEGPYQGNVCTVTTDESSDIVIAIVAGVSASLLLLIIISLGVFFYMRRTRKNVNLQEKNYKSRQMEMGNLKQVSAYDNKAYENDNQVDHKVHIIDPNTYALKLEELRPHIETLMTVLGDVRKKLHAMEETDPRVPTYKGVIHQLCRVLVLLHKKDSTTSIPSDALGLFEWAQQMLDDHRAQNDDENYNGGNDDAPINRISVIDVDLESPPVYATPHHHTSSTSNQLDGYYSSVPVPLDMSNNNYATINRSTAHSNNINRNIYSNTNNVKKLVNNVKGRGTVPQMGYFSNGRYYDPNPNKDVYAPTSSYSDRSTGPLSTFRADRPHSASLSLNADSEEGIDTEDDGQLDVFPFDPKDATEPVEV